MDKEKLKKFLLQSYREFLSEDEKVSLSGRDLSTVMFFIDELEDKINAGEFDADPS